MTLTHPMTRESLADWLDWCGVSEFQKDRCLRLHEMAERGEVGRMPRRIARSARAVHGPNHIFSVEGIAQHPSRCGCCGGVAVSPGYLEYREAADVRDGGSLSHHDQAFDRHLCRPQAQGEIVVGHVQSSSNVTVIDAACGGVAQ